MISKQSSIPVVVCHSTHTFNFRRNLSSASFAVLEILRCTVNLRGVFVLVEVGSNTEKDFIGSKLVPLASACCTGPKG